MLGVGVFAGGVVVATIVTPHVSPRILFGKSETCTKFPPKFKVIPTPNIGHGVS